LLPTYVLCHVSRCTIRLHLVALGATGHQGVARVLKRHVAALGQCQRFGEPLGVVLRAQCLSGLHAGTLPGNEGVVFAAKQHRDVVGHAGGDGVCYTGHETTPRERGCAEGLRRYFSRVTP